MSLTCSQRLHAGYIAKNPDVPIDLKLAMIESVTGLEARARTSLLGRIVVFDMYDNGRVTYSLTTGNHS